MASLFNRTRSKIFQVSAGVITMNNKRYILAIDQGTSSTKSLIFDEAGQAVAKGSEQLQTNYFENGFVEQDPEEIYQNVLTSVRKCMLQFTGKGFDAKDVAGIGISNQTGNICSLE